MKIINIKQRSPEWHAFRCTHIGASDAIAIMGLSPWKSIDDLLDEKVLGIDQSDNPYMQRGRELESTALECFESETGLIMFPMVGIHDDLDWMSASFDGMTIDRKHICEIKCPGKKDHDLALKGEIPKKYVPQLQHQIHVSGLDFTYYYSFGGIKGIILEVKRDQGFIDNMIEKEFEFWNHVQKFSHTNNNKYIISENYDCTTSVISGN